jgi:acyl-CoA thioesterase
MNDPSPGALGPRKSMTPQQIAEFVAQQMRVADKATEMLGMTIDGIGPGRSILSMAITESMLNGLGLCHGGYIFMLADSALGFASNSLGARAAAQQCAITYLNPGRLGDRLTATASLRTKKGRTGIFDISVVRQTPSGDEIVAEFRGQTRDIEGSWI